MSQVVRIQQDLDKLITSLRPTANKEFKVQMQDYFKRLNSSLYRPNSQNVQQTKEKILKKVAQRADSKSQIQCHQTINNIMISNQFQKKGELLKFFLKFSQINNASNNSKLFEVDGKITTLNQTQQTTYGMTSSINGLMNNNTSAISSNSIGNAFTKPRKQLSPEQLQPLRNKGSPEQGISQIDLIKQISYVMQNIESTLIKHTETDQFQLQQNINVSDTVRTMVSELCEIGWLYRKIIDLLKSKGSIEKALMVAVQDQMTEYYRWLAIIQNGIQMGSLNLRRLISWSYEPIQKLKWLAIILQSIQPFSGCQIISIVNAYRPRGEEPINALLNNLVGHMIKPLLHFIHNWVYKGQLTDDQKEFFVEERPKVTEPLEWFEKFRLVEANIPNILDRESAQMIFNAGKTIYFLKNRCRCNYSIPIPFIDHEKILNEDICESSNILSTEFKKWLTAVYEDLSQTLVSELKNQFLLKFHLESMKLFFLMGKGDFIQHLVDTLKQQMAKPKHQIYEHTLDGYIADAITKSFQDFTIDWKKGQLEKMQIEGQKAIKSRIEEGSQKIIMLKGSKLSVFNKKNKQINFDNSFRANILDRLISKKVDSSQNSWDAFNFQYSMQRIQPLYTLFTPDLVQNYQRVFQFLWKIRRIQHVLKQVWMLNQKQYPKTQKNKNFKQFSRILHRCHVLRTGMSHFVNTFYGYLMIAIQSAWDKFQLGLEKSKSLDDIIKQHRLMHSELASITLSSINKKGLRDSLMSVFRSIEQFKLHESRILTEYQQFFQNMRTYENRKKIMAKGILSMDEGELQIPSCDEEGLTKRLVEIGEVYNKSFRQFYEALKKEGEETKVLVFRLDFSEYFTTQQIYERF